MKRTKKKPSLSVDALLTADWHLREDQPTCRVDDFQKAQWNKVRQVRELQEKHGCPVLHAGDLFHHWKPSPALLSKCIEELPDQFYTVYGNHDLPQHSIDLGWKSGVNTLVIADRIYLLPSGNWNDEPEKPLLQFRRMWERSIYVWHKFTYTGKPPFPGAEKEATGHTLLNKYPQFDLILTGDNHQQFVCKSDDGRLLVNPGCLTRQTAAFKDFEPAVWLYNAERNKVKAHYFDTDPNAVSRIHIEKSQERDERIQAFVERLGTEWEAGLDFKENLKRFASENSIKQPIMEIAYKALEE